MSTAYQPPPTLPAPPLPPSSVQAEHQPGNGSNITDPLMGKTLQESAVIPNQLPSPPLLTPEDKILNETQTFYILRTANGCCTKTVNYDVFPGTRIEPGKMLLKLRGPTVNDCMCCSTCCRQFCGNPDGNFEWPIRIENAEGKYVGVMTLTESGRFPILLEDDKESIGRMRTSYKNCCCCIHEANQDVVGKLGKVVYSTKNDKGCCQCPACLYTCIKSMIKAAICATFFPLLFLDFCGICDCPLQQFYHSNRSDLAFNIYEACTIKKIIFPCCKGTRHFEIKKANTQVNQSHLLMILPVVAQSFDG